MFYTKMLAQVSVFKSIQNVPRAVHLGRFPVLSKPDSVPPAKLAPADSLFLPLARRPLTVGLHLCDRVRGPPLKLDTTKLRSPHCTKNSRKQVCDSVSYEEAGWMRVRGDQLECMQKTREKSLNSGTQQPKENSAHVRHKLNLRISI